MSAICVVSVISESHATPPKFAGPLVLIGDIVPSALSCIDAEAFGWLANFTHLYGAGDVPRSVVAARLKSSRNANDPFPPPLTELVTVTVKLQLSLFPEASVTIDFTIVVPTGKLEPELGVEIAATPGQLSEIVGAA
jgi:hypothetical protein